MTLRMTPALVALGLLAGAGGCRGEDVSFDCDNQKMKFERIAAKEQQPLLDEIPSAGPYPVALQISEEGLNRLVAGIIDDEVPFGGTLPFGLLPTGPGEATFEATSVPTLEIADVPRCPNCVLLKVDFGVELDSQGEPLSSGVGFVELAIPVVLEADEAAGTTTVVADYPNVFIHDWKLSVFGFDSETHDTIAGALKVLMEEEIAGKYDRVDLLTLGSWNIGAGNVKIVARELQLKPDLHKMVLGMHSNLPLPEGAGLDLSAELPEGVPMKVTIAIPLIQAMTYQMFAEGEIPRRYDEEGQADRRGLYGVTVDHMRSRAGAASALETQFRVWRIGEGYCGFATFLMGLTFDVNDTMTGVVVSAGAAVYQPDEAKEGIGPALEEEEELVEENQDLVDTFRAELTEQVGKTLAYDDLDVEGSVILFTTLEATVDTQGVHTLLDFLVLAEA